ncbi:50S ribosomal protein L2 [Candidatus Woesearchaeota archaeon CG_4_10_14_0_2_um_filter_33_13]|nr:MAG: 50S ribosomal protein L2 [Candidatus Woesearchaeota archaeon CG_4_10_14_0_2_um_filter_33_13]
MGKRIIQQRRGRGTMTYRSPGFRFKGKPKHYNIETSGVVTELVNCPGHSAPLMEVNFLSGEKGLTIAPEGIKVGDEISIGSSAEVKLGNVLKLKDIPEGTLIHNLEIRPGDGGKLVRSSGSFAKVVAKTENSVRIKLPSNSEKIFLPACRAAIGIIAGAGRLERPFLKAGTRFKKMKARNKLYPKVCGISMNAVDHPFGGKCSHIKGRPTLSPRSAPPGRKVGKIAPSRTGKRK